MAFKTTAKPSSPDDPRLAPAYSVAEAAHYLRMPEGTLRSWVVGRWYPVGGQSKRSRPLIHLDDPERQHLSFINLVEAHVLAAIRRRHGVKLPKVRTALDYIKRHFQIARPLIDQAFQTDGLDLFVERYGELINASRKGQQAMKDIISVYLTRIERDAKGLPIKALPIYARYRVRCGAQIRPPCRRHESGRFFRSAGDRGYRHTCFIHLRAIQGGRLRRRARKGLPSGHQCRRRSNPLRSRLMKLFSSSTGRWA